jgi:hypothetical protein
MIVVGILDIAIDDRHAGFEHRRKIAERLRGRRIEAREAGLPVPLGPSEMATPSRSLMMIEGLLLSAGAAYLLPNSAWNPL